MADNVSKNGDTATQLLVTMIGLDKNPCWTGCKRNFRNLRLDFHDLESKFGKNDNMLKYNQFYCKVNQTYRQLSLG